MSDFRERIPDDDREVVIDDEDVMDTPPTIDPLESVETEVDEQDEEEREAAIEAGQLDPSG